MAASCAWTAFSRASKARAIAPLTPGSRSAPRRSCRAPPRPAGKAVDEALVLLGAAMRGRVHQPNPVHAPEEADGVEPAGRRRARTTRGRGRWCARSGRRAPAWPRAAPTESVPSRRRRTGSGRAGGPRRTIAHMPRGVPDREGRRRRAAPGRRSSAARAPRRTASRSWAARGAPSGTRLTSSKADCPTSATITRRRRRGRRRSATAPASPLASSSGAGSPRARIHAARPCRRAWPDPGSPRVAAEAEARVQEAARRRRRCRPPRRPARSAAPTGSSAGRPWLEAIEVDAPVVGACRACRPARPGR